MEKSKSVLLLEALMAAKADKFAQVPDSLLEKERLLRSEITAVKKELSSTISFTLPISWLWDNGIIA